MRTLRIVASRAVMMVVLVLTMTCSIVLVSAQSSPAEADDFDNYEIYKYYASVHSGPQVPLRYGRTEPASQAWGFEHIVQDHGPWTGTYDTAIGYVLQYGVVDPVLSDDTTCVIRGDDHLGRPFRVVLSLRHDSYLDPDINGIITAFVE